VFGKIKLPRYKKVIEKTGIVYLFYDVSLLQREVGKLFE